MMTIQLLKTDFSLIVENIKWNCYIFNGNNNYGFDIYCEYFNKQFISKDYKSLLEAQLAACEWVFHENS